MPAFMVFLREKTLDQSELEAYWSRIRATLEGRPVKVLAAYGRHVTLEGPEVEGVVVFLASDDSGWLTGEIILASGGQR